MSDMDSGSDYGSVLSAAQHNPEPPLSYSKSTNTSIGRQTAWKSQAGMSLGKKNLGSTLNWDEGTAAPAPSPDTGVSFGGV
jgi:hypothetical protein